MSMHGCAWSVLAQRTVTLGWWRKGLGHRSPRRYMRASTILSRCLVVDFVHETAPAVELCACTKESAAGEPEYCKRGAQIVLLRFFVAAAEFGSVELWPPSSTPFSAAWAFCHCSFCHFVSFCGHTYQCVREFCVCSLVQRQVHAMQRRVDRVLQCVLQDGKMRGSRRRRKQEEVEQIKAKRQNKGRRLAAGMHRQYYRRHFCLS